MQGMNKTKWGNSFHQTSQKSIKSCKSSKFWFPLQASNFKPLSTSVFLWHLLIFQIGWLQTASEHCWTSAWSWLVFQQLALFFFSGFTVQKLSCFWKILRPCWVSTVWFPTLRGLGLSGKTYGDIDGLSRSQPPQLGVIQGLEITSQQRPRVLLWWDPKR